MPVQIEHPDETDSAQPDPALAFSSEADTIPPAVSHSKRITIITIRIALAIGFGCLLGLVVLYVAWIMPLLEFQQVGQFINPAMLLACIILAAILSALFLITNLLERRL